MGAENTYFLDELSRNIIDIAWYDPALHSERISAVQNVCSLVAPLGCLHIGNGDLNFTIKDGG